MNNESKKQEVLKALKDGLIVSCQAREGWPMYGEEIMAAFATAAECGGAVGIRANRPENIKAIRQKTSLPIIGINKIWDENYEVYITPTFHSAEEVIAAGCDIVAVDGTGRPRPGHESLQEIITKLKSNYPDKLIMADISTPDEGIESARLGADLVATTLSGYTEYTKDRESPDLALIRDLSASVTVPIIAEGKIHTPQQALQALQAGAYAVVVGTAITRPEVITKWFSEKIKEFNN